MFIFQSNSVNTMKNTQNTVSIYLFKSGNEEFMKKVLCIGAALLPSFVAFYPYLSEKEE